MLQRNTLVLIGCLISVLAAWNLLSPVQNAHAQPPKAGPKWEYGTLEYYEPTAGIGSHVIWTTGKKIMGAKSEKFLLECVSKLNKDLGGKEETAGLGVLLDRIGEDGWELVTHTRAATQMNVTQIWTFKRQLPRPVAGPDGL